MKIGCKISWMLPFILLGISSTANSDVPSVMNYQGRLTDTNDKPLNGLFSMNFRIYDNAEEGQELWTETQEVSVVNGLFGVLLGIKNPLDSSLFRDPNRYLGIQIGSEPEIRPRRMLATVAYAFRTPGGAAGGINTAKVTETETLSPGDSATASVAFVDSVLVFSFGIPQGLKGDAGIAGSPGIKGDPGPPGVTSARVTATNNLGASDSATVSVDLADSMLSFAFGIPKGNKGDPGDKGDKGDPAEIAPGSTISGSLDGYILIVRNDGSGNAFYGRSENATAILGRSYADGNNPGIRGVNEADGVAGRFDNSSSTNYTVRIGNTTSTMPGLYVDGYFTATGTKNAVVETKSFGKRITYADESTEVFFFDRGQARLVNGQITVNLDPIFLETVTIDEDYPILVQVTLTADCNGIFVSETTQSSFTVKELVKGTSDATLNWEVAAKRKGYETRRLEYSIEEEHRAVRK